MQPKPAGGVINKSHQFALNLKFQSNKARININVPVPQQRQAESAQTHQSIVEDRKFLVQAAIVRIMKMRQRMPHGALMSEVVSQLSARFKPKIAVIKRAIDALIEREYIERAEGEADVYLYVA